MLLYPFLPNATEKIWVALGQSGKLERQLIDETPWGSLMPGTRIGKLEAVYPRVEKKETSERIEAMENEIRNPGSTQPAATTPTSPASTVPTGAGATGAAAAAAPAPGAKITIDDFAKVELRVGVVKSAENVQGADKLLKVMVDIGDEVRQVLAGIATGLCAGGLGGAQSGGGDESCAAKNARAGVERDAAGGVGGGGWQAGAVTFAEEIPAGAKVK